MKKRRIPRLLAPANVRTMDEVCALRRDHYDVPTGWIMLNGPFSNLHSSDPVTGPWL